MGEQGGNGWAVDWIVEGSGTEASQSTPPHPSTHAGRRLFGSPPAQTYPEVEEK